MALAQIAELRAKRLMVRSRVLGRSLQRQLEQLAQSLEAASNSQWQFIPRGMGLMAGFEIRGADGRPGTTLAIAAVKAMLRRGYLLLPEGEHSEVISLTPPLIIGAALLTRAV